MAKKASKMVEVELDKIKEAEDAIRDLLNWVEVWNLEESEAGIKIVSDSVVDELKSKLEELARKVSLLNMNV
jgi:hypothetical protein